VTPSAFSEKATALDEYKSGLWSNLAETKNATLAAQLVADLNVMHGKAGHSENVKAFSYALLAKPEVSALLGLEGPSARFQAAFQPEQTPSLPPMLSGQNRLESDKQPRLSSFLYIHLV
jgi:hypothetical protein